jgi:Tfp pilus assembly protein PilN
VGIVRQSTLSHYETLFSEAGIPMAAATFSSAVIYAALRLPHAAPASVFCYMLPGKGRVEIYGESEAKPCYSAGFAVSTERALAVARAELRFSQEQAAIELAEALTAPPAISPVAYAAALAASAPLAVRFANLLPAARRASHSRTQYVAPVALAVLFAIGLLTVFVLFPLLNERRYVRELTAEQSRLAPVALRVQSIDKTLAAHRARIAALDDFRRRPQADLDVLNELVRILPEKVWTDSIEIFPDSIVIGGEAEQAEPLLKLLESSPLFQNAQFVMSVAHKGDVDVFRIKAMRRGRAGRNTP